MNTAMDILKKVNSWDEFKIALIPLSKKKKGDTFELVTKFYFKINPVLSDYYEDVWLFSEVPQKVLEYLGLPPHDLGIDLIAKHGNEYHAIQCKYHSEKSKSVTFKEVSTFISLLASNDKLAQGYICSSANITSRNYNQLETKPINLILADTWQTLNKEFFNQVRKLLARKKYAPKPLSPRKHQKEALKQSEKHFIKENNSRGKLIFPCGSGKSLTGYWMTQRLKSKSTIIAVPSLSLIKQTLDVYLREIVANGIKVKWLCICSDEGIGKNDDIVFKTENLGVPCQTDPDYIENWLKENRNERKIVFTTYQSGRIIAEISKKLNFNFDVGIFDEAHKTVGSKKKLFSHLLFEENISINKRIFMTATERFYSGSKDDIISMDNYDIYGDTFAHMSFKEAIELDLLTDYKVITIEVKKSEISDFIKENNLVQLNDKWKKETEARSLASMLALRKAMKQFPIRNAVSFHSSIDKAVRNKELQQHITETYNYQPIDTYTVSGKMPTTKRNDIVQEFARSSRALITNARCLTEGVDVPNIDCIVFADPRKSKVDIVQALGRALRKKEGKDWGYVVLPVVYDEESHEIDNENFNEILAIVRGLASNDERIVEYFKDKHNISSGGQYGRESDIFNVFSDYLNEEDLSNQLQIKLWDKLSKFNWMPFEDAKYFVRSLNLKSANDWREYVKSGNKPDDIPAAPEATYSNDVWKGYGDWLGTGRVADRDKIFRPFKEARKYVQKLGLAKQHDWYRYTKSGKKPEDIPTAPQGTYSNDGWLGFGDWLGTGTIATFKREYRPFMEARDFVHKLKLINKSDWLEYSKSGNKPDDIPAAPEAIYSNDGWKGNGDWLGTGFIATRDREFRSFEDAREFVRSLNLKNNSDWQKYSKSGNKPDDIPATPERTYSNDGWLGFGDWLGTGTIAARDRKFWSFEEAQKFVHKLDLKGQKQWRDYCKSGNKPIEIPSTPENTYKDKGWKDFGDWLGSGTIATFKREYKPFEEAKDFVHKLGLKNQNQWVEYCKSGTKPEDIPANPQRTYSNDGWQRFGDWLGTGTIAARDKRYRPFKEAREFVQKLGLKNREKWREYCKSGNKPDNIPSTPEKTYKNKGWQGLGDWLGTGTIASKDKEYRSFKDARDFVRMLGLKSQRQWGEYCKSGNKPDDIPATPERTYKNKGWQGLGYWLGTGTIAPRYKVYRTFEDAREIIRKLDLKSRKDWREYCKSGDKPDDIPSTPENTYKNKGWKYFGDWSGTETIATFKRVYKPFKEARNFVHKLGLKSQRQWVDYYKSGNKPHDIPAAPERTYSDKGWQGIGDWLGL